MIKLISQFNRFKYATHYYNAHYKNILKWTIESNEDTNYTYDLTDRNILYLANVLSVITQQPLDEVLKFISELRENEALKKFVIEMVQKSKFAHRADNRCDFGRRLGWYALVRITKPKLVVETGVDKGLGSVVLCEALRRNELEGYPGRYIGTDINPNAGYLLTGDFKIYGQILYGDSIESLNKLADPIDVFINDSDHSADYEYREYKAIEKNLTSKSIILGDNSHCTDKLAVFSREKNRKFLFFKEEPRNHWYPGAGIGFSYN
jgi:predicted O-methyltransferase YrrM